MKLKYIASVLLALLSLLVTGCSRVPGDGPLDDKVGDTLPVTRSVETVTFQSNGRRWLRTWDVETGIVCYRRTNEGAANSCAHSPNKPYPLRDEVGDDHNQ